MWKVKRFEPVEQQAEKPNYHETTTTTDHLGSSGRSFEVDEKNDYFKSRTNGSSGETWWFLRRPIKTDDAAGWYNDLYFGASTAGLLYIKMLLFKKVGR